MDSIRRLNRKTWITQVVLGVFLLWSSMAICLLPDLGETSPVHMGAHTSMHADCLGGDTPTFCKSEARNGMLPDLAKLATIAVPPLTGLTPLLVFAPPAPIARAEPVIRPPLIYLLACRFLK